MQRILSFDGTESEESIVVKPDKYNTLFNTLSKGNFIPRGAGLNYCLASAAKNSTSIDARNFNRILDFNDTTGIIKVEAGISVGDILNFSIAKKFTLPVLPGYPRITIGGCIACNIHGKSQYNIGLFESCVKSIKLFHPTHGEIFCDNQTNSDAFELTVGGFGLTGFITEVELQLIPLEMPSMLRIRHRVSSFSEAIETIQKRKDQFRNVYSWNNLNKSRDEFGSGFVYLEKSISENIPVKKEIVFNTMNSESRSKLKFQFLNSYTSSLETYAFEFLESFKKKEEKLPYAFSAFPINGKEIYFYLFGRKGLREYQTIIPYSNWGKFENDLHNLIKETKISPSLGSLKHFEGIEKLVHFNKSGLCLAIDVPNSERTKKFMDHLDEIVVSCSGISNIAKDGRLRKSVVQKMYPEYDLFISKLKQFEGANPLNSSLRERLF